MKVKALFGLNYKWATFCQKLTGKNRQKVTEYMIGGDFEHIGKTEKEILTQFGLKPNDVIIDIGCGGARLGYYLKEMQVKYIGLDVVSEFLEHAKEITKRQDWEFIKLKSNTIPLENNSANFCVFFSVFTHLEENIIINYMKEAKRVLRPNGKIIVSFLDSEHEEYQKLLDFSFWDKIKRKLFYPKNFIHTKKQIMTFGENNNLELIYMKSPHKIGQAIAIFENKS